MTINEYLAGSKATENYLVVGEETSLEQVMEAAAGKRHARLVLVTDREGRVIGVATPEMLARHHLGEGVFRKKGGFLPGGAILGHLSARSVGDIMERQFVFCLGEDTLEQVGHRVARNHLSTMIPVLDEKGGLAGVVDMVDVLAGEGKGSVMEAAVDSLEENVVVIGPEGKIAACNRGWRRFALENGGDPDYEWIGADYLAVIAADPEQKPALEGIRAVMAGELPRFSMEYPCHSPTEKRWFLFYATPLEDRPGYAVLSHLPITQRVLAEQELARLNGELEERVREEVAKGRERDEIVSRQSRYAIMGETMTMVAHQWRQPLQNLVLMVEDFKEAFYAGELDQEYMETYGQEVIAQAIELSHTISEFSGFFTREKEKSRFSLAIPVREAADVIGFTMKGMGIVLEVRVPPEIEVIGYPREFRQVLINLLVNAKEVHMARGTPNPWIRVTGARRDGKGVLVVEDNAGGVAPELRERIFEPYFSTKGPASGTGVGLYISKVVVERNMEGTLVAENGEEGARFTVALPLA